MSTPTNWLTAEDVLLVQPLRNTISIPVFTYAATFVDVSDVQVQFNFTATRDFTLLKLPIKPTGADYVPAIRFRVGSTVYRYLLWEDDNLVLGDYEVYNNQIIGKNFVIEIYNLSGQTTVSNAAAIVLDTSIRTVPSDYRSFAKVAQSDPTTVLRSVLLLQNDSALPAGLDWHINPQDATTMVLSGSNLTSITEDVGQADDLIKFIGTDAVVGTQPLARSKTTLDFNAGQYQMITPLVHPVTGLRDFYVVFEPKAHNNGAVMITNIGVFKLIQGTSIGEYDFTNGFVNFTISGILLNNIYLLHFRWETSGGNDIVTATPYRLSSTGPVWEVGLAATDTQVAGGMTAAASPTFNGNTSRFKLLEFIAYNEIVDESSVFSYIRNLYTEDFYDFGSDDFIDFIDGTNNQWLDNPTWRA